MEHKTHFKLHKVKKHWITIAISSLTLGIIASTGNIAYAEQSELPLTNQTIENSIVFEESAINTSNTFIDEKTTSQSESSLETSTNHSTTTDTYTVDNNSKVSLPEDSTVPSSSEASLEGATNVSEASSIETQEDNSITGGNFITDEYGNWYYIKDNQKLTGFQTVDGVPLYFDQDGIQAKGNFVTVDNETYYFDKDSGRKLTNQFVTDGGYGWYYLGADGKAVKGAQTIDNFDLYFDDRGYQIKGSLVNIGEQTYYFDPYNGRKVKDKKIYVHGGTFYFDESGAAVKNRFISDNEGFWYYFDKDGHMVTFSQIIDGYSLYFHSDGKQAKGQLISIWGNHTGTHYFDKDNGREVKNAIFELDGKSYEADENGIVKELPPYRNQYISENGNDWSYYDGFGHKLIGLHNIDGVNVYFDDNGIQAKGKITTIGTDTYFFEKDNGAMRTNQLSVIPPGMKSFGTAAFLTATNKANGLTSILPYTFIILVLVCAVMHFVLHYTIFGRGIYAIGGNPQSAHTAGFNVKRTKFIMYIIIGMIASASGICRVCMMQQMHPTNMLGMEMNIIAGVVLGGVALTGGAGTLTGCILGTFLIILVQNSMILLGIPTTWSDVFVGLVIVIGVSLTAWQSTRTSKSKKKAVKEGA